MAAQTLFEKIWNSHVVHEAPGEPALLYIDLHLIHEVTSPQAFEALALAGRKVRALNRTFATLDHNIPTTDRSLPITDPDSKKQIEMMRKNCRDFGVKLFDLGEVGQGIVHVAGPEQGFVLPGLTVICGDSHTCTNGALGALAFGVGSSQSAQALATRVLLQQRPRRMRVTVSGTFGPATSAKDLALHLISTLGASAGVGYAIEYAGSAVTAMEIEQRFTLFFGLLELLEQFPHGLHQLQLNHAELGDLGGILAVVGKIVPVSCHSQDRRHANSIGR